MFAQLLTAEMMQLAGEQHAPNTTLLQVVGVQEPPATNAPPCAAQLQKSACTQVPPGKQHEPDCARAVWAIIIARQQTTTTRATAVNVLVAGMFELLARADENFRPFPDTLHTRVNLAFP